MFNYKDCNVVVTGGAQGIGRGISRAFLRAGAHVFIVDHQGAALADAHLWLHTLAQHATFIPADISQPLDVQAVFDACAQQGGIDVLINNAGISYNGIPIEELTLEQFDRVMRVNVYGSFLCAKAAVPQMKEKGRGAIVNLASTRALMSEPNTEAYSASKGAIVALTHSLAVSLGPTIRVNCISPGWIDVTPHQQGALRGESLSERDHSQHPAGRVGNVDDIANACLYLCSQAAGFITGANWIIDGGMTRKMIYAD